MSEPMNAQRPGAMLFFFAALGLAAAVSFGPGEVRAAEALSAQERAAVRLATDLFSAAKDGGLQDPQQRVAMMADDVVFKATPDSPEIKGKEAMLAAILKFRQSPVAKRLTPAKTPKRVVAMGGPKGTTVLVLREDYVIVNGKTETIPLAATLWIVGGKVKAWYDFPLADDPDKTNWGETPNAGGTKQ